MKAAGWMSISVRKQGNLNMNVRAILTSDFPREQNNHTTKAVTARCVFMPLHVAQFGLSPGVSSMGQNSLESFPSLVNSSNSFIK